MEHFEQMAANYDTESRIRRAKQIAAKLREYFKDTAGKRALEYGCGTGLVSLQLADLFAGMLLVDSSPAMIEQLNRKLGAKPSPHVSVLQADFLADALPVVEMDYIITSLVLHHIKDIESILRCFYSLLNKGGQLLIVDLIKDDGSFHANCADYHGHDGFDPMDLGALLISIGFSAFDSEVFLHDAKVIDGKEYPYSIFILRAQK